MDPNIKDLERRMQLVVNYLSNEIQQLKGKNTTMNLLNAPPGYGTIGGVDVFILFTIFFVGWVFGAFFGL